MLDVFATNSGTGVRPELDLQVLQERLAQALLDAGVDPESRAFRALYKMLRDDVVWYLENTAE